MYFTTKKLLIQWMAVFSLVLCLSAVNAIHAQINLEPNSSFATCLNSADGTATVIATGGVQPYSYQWSTGSTFVVIYNLLPGDYQVTVTDATGAVATTNVTVVTGPEGIWLMPVSTPASCGACDGTANPDAMLGAPPYTYQWSDGQTSATATGLCPGEYTVTVTDTQGCANSATVFVGSAGNLNVSASSTDTGCNGNDGTATANPSGGMAPYTYNWSNGATTQTISGLSPGTYTVTVTSADGCQGVASVTVGGSGSDLSVNTSSTPTECGSTDGTATANGSGGVPPYVYTWSNGGTTQTITNLAPGVYIVTITDSQGCTSNSTVEVAGSSAPTAGTISTNDPTTICAGDGIPDPITLTVTGATMGTTAQWVVTDANGNILSLPPSNVIDLDGAGEGACLIWYLVYDGTIQGAEIGNNASAIEGCFDLSNNIEVIRLSTEPATISTQDPTAVCVGDMMDDFVDVSIDDAGQGTNSTWVITDANGVILSLPMMPPFNFENAGIGNCLIWYLNFEDGLVGAEVGANANDLEGCFSLSDPIEVNREEVGVVTITPDNPTICPGEEVTFTATSTVNATYVWFAAEGLLSSPDEATTTYTMMEPGTYQILVSTTTDGGCMGMAMTSVTVLDGPVVNIVDDPNGNTICNPGESLDLTVNNPMTGVTYSWTASAGTITENGASATYTMMMPGTYTITVEATDDVSGCSTSSTTTATVGIFDITVEESSPISMCGATDGEATATTNGGNGNFTYEWSNGSTDATATDLADGNYTVTVTDELTGCTQVGTVFIAKVGISIGNYVWADNNENCAQDANESGLESVPVNLMGPGPDGIPCNADDEIIESTNTDSDGLYLFECIAPGTYYVQFFATVVYNGMEYTCIDGDGQGNTDPSGNNDDLTDSDVDPETGKTMPFDVLDVNGDGIPETIDMNGDGINDKDELSLDAGVFETCNNVNSGGQIGTSQMICAGEVPAKLTNIAPAGGGGTAPIEYLWICSPTGGVPNPATWVNVPNSNSDCLQLGPVFQTQYYARCARREGCPEFVFESNIIVIEVVACSQIVTFNTNMTADASVQLSWITDNDTPNAMYHVERSADGANFEVLAEIPSKYATLSAYAFSDTEPMKGMNYYRIKRVDDNGNYYFTDISEEMNIADSDVNFEIFPNPVSANLTLENLSLIDGDVQVEIISATGITKKGLKMDASSYNTSSIEMNDLPAGVYYLRITHTAGEVDLIKFTKIN